LCDVTALGKLTDKLRWLCVIGVSLFANFGHRHRRRCPAPLADYAGAWARSGRVGRLRTALGTI
jgi:hypothetical protein